MGTINYTTAQLNKMSRVQIEPYVYNSYLTIPAIGLSLTTVIKNKVVLATTTVGVPNGFDLYVTPQGSALRFIGSGLGNGDTAIFSIKGHISSTTGNQATLLTYKLVKRHYTEVNFQNAVECPGYSVPQDMPNNSTEALSIVAPDIEISDGELLELAVVTSATITGTFDFNQFSFNIREEYIR